MVGFEVRLTVDTRKLDRLTAESRTLLEAVLDKAGLDVEGKAKQIIVDKDIIDTGATLNSTKSRREGPLARRIGPTTSYAIWLEIGTHRMPARPFMVPALEQARGPFEQAIAEVFKRG